jgi:hypothetical protein
MRWVSAIALTVAAGLPAAVDAEVEVRNNGGRLDLRATATPLADVLDRLARTTGMKVVHEGAPPRQQVTLALAGRTHAEAVLGVLDGQGLNYALKMDATGTRVEMLILAGAATPSTAPPPAAPPLPMARPVPVPQPPPNQVEEEEPPPEDEDAAAVEAPQKPRIPGQPREGATGMQPGAPGQVPHLVVPPGAGNAFPVSPFAPAAPSLPTITPAQPNPPTESEGEATDETEQ